MIEIIPGVLYDSDFRFFDEQTYSAMYYVLDDVLCNHLATYTENPNADAAIVENINKYYGKIIQSYQLPRKLKEMGILDLVYNLTPQSLLNLDIDIDNVIEKIGYLYDKSKDIVVTYGVRKREHYDNLCAALTAVARRKRDAGCYDNPEMLKAVTDNSFLFYTAHERLRSTGLSAINDRRRSWLVSLRGAQFLKYCNEHNIPTNERRAF